MRHWTFNAATITLAASGALLVGATAAGAQPSPSPGDSPSLSTSQSPTPGPSPSPGPPPLDITGSGGLWFIGVMVALIALLAIVPVIVDANRAVSCCEK
jgi:hypothetical protein